MTATKKKKVIILYVNNNSFSICLPSDLSIDPRFPFPVIQPVITSSIQWNPKWCGPLPLFTFNYLICFQVLLSSLSYWFHCLFSTCPDCNQITPHSNSVDMTDILWIMMPILWFSNLFSSEAVKDWRLCCILWHVTLIDNVPLASLWDPF